MRIAICDDEIIELEKMNNLITSFFKTRNIPVEIEHFTDPELLLKKLTYFYDEALFDVYFLDVIMNINGITVSKKIREIDKNCLIIFTTTSKDFAIDAFSVNATDYLLKPINKETLYLRLDSIVSKYKIKNNFFFKTASHSMISIEIDQITYIESFDRRMIIHLANDEKISSPVLRNKFLASIPFDFTLFSFVNCHSSFVVNMNYIKAIEGKNFIMQNSDIVPISKRIYTEVKNKYINYLIGN